MATEINDNLRQILKILCEDSVLLQQIGYFMDLLQISNSTRNFVTQEIAKGTSTFYDLLRTVLNEWCSRNGKKASINSLVKELRNGEFNACAGETIKTLLFKP
jgi:hypothetical protein